MQARFKTRALSGNGLLGNRKPDMPGQGFSRITAFSESRPLRFTNRQTFLLEQTRSPPMGFHESRGTNHETRPLRPFGSTWISTGRTTGNRRARSPVTASLPTVSRHFPVKNCPRASVRPPSAVLGLPRDKRRYLGNPTNVHRIPDPPGKCSREKRLSFVSISW